MSQKPRRKFTAEQKAEAVRIVEESGKPISRVAKEMGLTKSALRNWVKQSKIDQQGGRQGPLTSEECSLEELWAGRWQAICAPNSS